MIKTTACNAGDLVTIQESRAYQNKVLEPFTWQKRNAGNLRKTADTEQSYLEVADNSGARKLMCIRVLGGSRKIYKVVM